MNGPKKSRLLRCLPRKLRRSKVKRAELARQLVVNNDSDGIRPRRQRPGVVYLKRFVGMLWVIGQPQLLQLDREGSIYGFIDEREFDESQTQIVLRFLEMQTSRSELDGQRNLLSVAARG